MTALDEMVEAAIGEGFEVVQEGRVLIPHVAGVPCGEAPSCSERWEGFSIHLLGAHAAPTYRSQFENRLLDGTELDGEKRWVHLRRDRRV